MAGPAGLLCSRDPKLDHHIWVWGNTEFKEATRRPRCYSQRTGWDKFSETFGFVLWRRVPLTQSHHCVQKGESIEESHALLPYGEWTDRLCCWVKTFPQLANKRRRRSSLTGTSRDRDTQNKEGQNTRDCSVWPLLFAEVIPRNQPHLCHAMTSVQF